MSHTNLLTYYKTSHTIAEKGIYSLTEIDAMQPFEFEARVLLYIMELEEQAEKARQGNG